MTNESLSKITALTDKQQLLVKMQLRDQQNLLTAKQQLAVKAQLAGKRA